jgi:hypothetical protein
VGDRLQFLIGVDVDAERIAAQWRTSGFREKP